jgi:hypothetical protein
MFHTTHYMKEGLNKIVNVFTLHITWREAYIKLLMFHTTHYMKEGLHKVVNVSHYTLHEGRLK